MTLERIAEPAGAWKAAVEVLVRAADATDALEAKKSLLFRVARMEDAEIGDRAAAEAAYRKVLELNPEDDIAQIGIEELKRASGDAEALVEILLEKVEGEQDASERASTLREIGQLYEDKLESPDNAFVAYVQALADDPRDERTAREIERLATTPERWNEAMTTLSEALEHHIEPGDKAHLYTLMGRWYADKLSRPDFAIGCYGQALGLDPQDDGAYDGIVALYEKAQSWQELVQILLRRADTTGNPARARDFRVEAADLMRRKLSDADRALEMFRAVLVDDPAHPKAAAALEEMLADRGEWKELVALVEERAKAERGEAKVAALAHIAELYEDRLDDVDQAAARYEQALVIDPRHLPSLKGLERAYAKAGKYRELRANLEAQLGVMATPRQKIGLLERIGALQEEEFVDHAKAAEAFEQIVAVELGHEAANTALERLYRHLQRFDDLADTLDRHAKATEDDKRKIDLLMQAVRVMMVEVGAPERAMQFCERVLAIEPEHTEALDQMARLQASTGDATAAVLAVERLADSEKDTKKRAELWVRAGRLLEDAGDKDRAIERYKQALDADAENATAASALRAIYTGRGDDHGAAELLLREIDVTEGSIRKASLYAELGELYQGRLEEPAKAHEAYRKALDLDPTCTPAARGLGDMAYDEGDIREAVKLYEPLLARTSEMPPPIARDVSLRTGDAFQRLGQFDKAQRAFLNAKAFAKNDRGVLERVAELTFESGEPDEAAELYRDILERFRAELSAGERGHVLYRVAEATRRAGHGEEAIPLFNEAAQLRPEDPLPFAGLAQVYEEQGKWEQVVRTVRRRMEQAEDEERFDLLVKAGDVLLEKLGDRAKASKSYVAALEIRADDRNLLTKLMGVYSESKDWSRLVEVILRIAELVDDPKQLGKYYVTAASIAHEELGRLDEAADYYQQALEHDASLERAFRGLVKAFGQKQDWQKLVDAYRQHLDRVAKTAPPERRAELWDALADVLLNRLDAKGEAAEAFEHAQQLDPDSRHRTEQLAAIYATDSKRYFQKATHAHQQLLQMSPFRIESYQALRRLYTEMKRPDEAWCTCQTLRVLSMADPEEEAFFKKHRSRTAAAAQEFFTEEIWFNHVIHPEQDPLLSGIFATIAPAVMATRSQPLASFNLDASKKRDPENDPSPMAQTLHYAAGVTQIKLPDVYHRADDAGGLSILYTDPPAVGLGQGALAGGPAQALAFVAGRHLSYFRPGHYLRHLVPTGSGLRAWLLAAIKTAVPQFPVPPDLTGSVQEHLGAFQKHILGPQLDQLHSLVQKLLAAAPELDMKRWVAAIDLTADRVGFILSNDLEITSAVIKASPEDAAAVPQKERLKELYLYSVSDAYLQLRHKLGLAIGE